jgi:hypothetical protein
VWEEPRLGFEKTKNIYLLLLLFDMKKLENSPQISKFSQICI